MEREGHGFSRAARVTDFGFSRSGHVLHQKNLPQFTSHDS